MIIEIEELIKGIEITDWTVFGLAILCAVSITTCVLLFAEVNRLTRKPPCLSSKRK